MLSLAPAGRHSRRGRGSRVLGRSIRLGFTIVHETFAPSHHQATIACPVPADSHRASYISSQIEEHGDSYDATADKKAADV